MEFINVWNLPFITLFNADVVVPPSHVHLGEVPGLLQLVNQFLDEGQGVSVLDRHLIELAVVLDWAQ